MLRTTYLRCISAYTDGALTAFSTGRLLVDMHRPAVEGRDPQCR
jgi:hypothetical protein